jgi:hypothetical protein
VGDDPDIADVSEGSCAGHGRVSVRGLESDE